MVMRDPFYEYNTDPVNYPNATNRTALERQAMELAAAGVKWVRMEFFADYDGSVKAGDINWAKYDWFIKELAPKYGLKVLALLNVGMVSHEGQTLRTLALNDPPDGAGSDPGDGSNHFIRVFTGRAQAIAYRYGSAISAYEIINEPNISWDLWQDSRLGSAEMRPERYSALITSAYRGIKTIAPGLLPTHRLAHGPGRSPGMSYRPIYAPSPYLTRRTLSPTPIPSGARVHN